MRGSRGPRQPGGGRQLAGPRHSFPPPKREAHGGEGRRAKRAGVGGFKQAKFLPTPDRSPPLRAAPQGEGSAHSTVQNVAVTADESGMRVDRFLEARFPGLSFSHIQRVIRKGEVRVNGKRTQPKNRLEEGQSVRIPPLRLDAPKPHTRGSEADEKTREFLKSITLYEDADVLVLNKPMGLAVQGGSGTTRHIDGMLEVLRDAHGQRPRLVHRLDKDTAGCLLVAKTRFAAAANRVLATKRQPAVSLSRRCTSRGRCPCASRIASSMPSIWRVVPEPPCTASPIGLFNTITSASS